MVGIHMPVSDLHVVPVIAFSWRVVASLFNNHHQEATCAMS